MGLPKAGDPNPIVKLGVVARRRRPCAVGGSRRSIRRPISSSSTSAGCQTADRSSIKCRTASNHGLDVNIVPAFGPGTRRPSFEKRPRPGSMSTGRSDGSKDGSFLWVSDRSGWKHLYRYKPDGSVRWARHNRRVGHPYRPRRRRKDGLGVFLGRRTKSHRRRRLSSEARWQRDEAVIGARGYPSSALQPRLDSITSIRGAICKLPRKSACTQADGDEVRVIHESKIPQLAEFRIRQSPSCSR